MPILVERLVRVEPVALALATVSFFTPSRSPTQSLAHDRNLTAYWKTREEGSASLESFLARPDSPSPSPDGDSDSTGGAAQGDGGRLVELPELASYKEAVELMARNMSREEEEKEGEKEREGEEEKEGDKESGRLGDKVKPSGSGKGKQKRGKKRV